MKWALVFVALSGCAHQQIAAQWAEPEELSLNDTSLSRDAAAVVLLREDKTRLTLKQSESSYSQRMRHEAIALLRESAFDLAEVKIPLRAKDRLLQLKARLHQPGKEWEELPADAFLSDQSGTAERDLNVHVFRFPRVEPGAIVEYFYVVESPNLSWGDEQDTLGEHPVQRYRFEVDASKVLALEAREYNSTFPIRTETRGDGSHRLWCELKDLPPASTAANAPHWTFTQPWWAWRLLAFQFPNESYDALRSWTDLAETVAAPWYGVSGTQFDGWETPARPQGCNDNGCLADKAHRALVDRLTLVPSGSVSSARPIRAVITSGEGTSLERALVLRRTLADYGLDARLALVTTARGEMLDLTFPSTARFNVAFVYLPAQPGLPVPRWFDMGCNSCAAGQVTAWVDGADAFVFRAIAQAGSPDIKSEWLKVSGPPAPGNRFAVQQHFSFVLDEKKAPTATLVGSLGRTFEGADGQREAENGRVESPKQRSDDEGHQLRGRTMIGEVTRIEPRTCSPLTGCTSGVKLSLRHAAVREGVRWWVPLAVLTTRYDTWLPSPERKEPLELSKRVDEEELLIDAPPGFQLEKVPASVALSGPLVALNITFEKVPEGVRVRRVLRSEQGTVSPGEFPKVWKVLEAWRELRSSAVVFAPSAGEKKP